MVIRRAWRRGSRLAGGLFTAALLFSAPSLSASEVPSPHYAGRTLVEALTELRRAGLVLIYSSAVVPEDLVVAIEPVPGSPRTVLVQLLVQFGLEARDAPGGAIVIVPAASADGAPRPAQSSTPIDLSWFTTEVVVTPGRHALADDEQEAARVMTPVDTLRVPNVGGDVSRMAERLPGIASRDNSAAFHARGSLERDTALVLDGLELYAPYHLIEFQAPFSLLDSRLAGQVELLNGGFTADRGDRLGSFLDVTTVVPADRAAEIELGTLNSRVSYGAPLPRNEGAWLASVRAWYPEALLDSLEIGAGERLRPRLGDAYGKLTWSVAPAAVLSLHGLLAQDRLNWQERGDPDNEDVDAETESTQVWLRLVAALSGGIGSDTVLSGGRIDASRAGTAAPDSGRVFLDDERELRFFGLTHDLQWEFAPSQLVRAGFLFRNEAAEYRYANEFEADPSASRLFEASPSGTSWGAYVAYRARISAAVTAELGLRWDRQQYTDDSQLDPRVNVLWRIGERSDLRLSAGQYSQSQRIHELQIEDGETSFRPAESSRQVQATFRHLFTPALRLRIDAYHHELSDLRPRYENPFQPLDLFPETSADRVEIAPTSARLWGIEVLLSGDPERPLYWWASYTRSSAEDLIDGEYVPRSWDQPSALKFLVGYQWRSGWFISLAGSAHTGWPTTPVSAVGVLQPDGSIVVEPVLGPWNSERFPDYRRLDLRIRRSFAFTRSRFSLTLDVINLTDRENACCVDDLEFGEPVVGQVAVQSVYSYWLGRTPSLYLRWEF